MSYSPKQLAAAYPARDQESLSELIDIDVALKTGLQKLLLNPRKSADEKLAQINGILPNLSKNTQKFLQNQN